MARKTSPCNLVRSITSATSLCQLQHRGPRLWIRMPVWWNAILRLAVSSNIVSPTIQHHSAGSVCYVWRSAFVHVCIQVRRRNMFESLPVTLPPSVSLLGSGSLTQCWIQTYCSDVLRWKSCIHLPESAIQSLRCSGAITGSQTPLLASSQMGRAAGRRTAHR